MRTLFLVITVFACWLAYELNWVRERHAVLATWQGFSGGDNWEDVFRDPVVPVRAPGLLWLFGETGYGYLERIAPARADHRLTAEEQAELQRVQRLFPEAKVAWTFWPIPPLHEATF